MKEFSERDLKNLAIAIYELDEEVYEILGSSLGRVFNTGRNRAIIYMVSIMRSGKGYVLRNEMALISNMARTIPDRMKRREIMGKYKDLLDQIMELPTNQMQVDIADEERMKLNSVHLKHRFDEDDKFIICIERTYGCGGTGIGFALADALQINYYDDEIFDEVLKRLEAEKKHNIDHGGFSYKNAGDKDYQYMQPSFRAEERTSFKRKVEDFSRYHGLPKRDAQFFNQSHLLCDMAKEEDFVIMGHCADIILTRNHIPHISIFLTAPFEQRVQRILKVNKDMDEKTIRKLVKTQDQKYGQYYKFFTGLDWEDLSHYDIAVNCAAYGVQGTIDMIMQILERNLKK